uniref:Uncharacterized protein n=1 Tax=Arundo donax TaxID=35708 RepID=A0A0A9HCL7_ARUDO
MTSKKEELYSLLKPCVEY